MSIISDLYTSLFGKDHIQDGNVIDFAEHGRVGGVSTGQPFKYVMSPGIIDTNNSTTTILNAGQTWTGTGTDITDYSGIAVLVDADVTGTLTAQFSSDNSDWHNGETYTIPAITAGNAKFFTPPAQGAYFRLYYVNDGSNQTRFHIHSVLKPNAIKWSSHNLNDNLRDDDDAELGVSVLKLRTAQNNYVSGAATNSGNFKISLEEYNGAISRGGLPTTFTASNQSAFGTLETAELEPSVQLDFVYGINTQTGVSTTANGATVDTNASRLRLQTGTNSAGSAIFRSRRTVKYRPGQGITARFTPVWTTGVANSTQIWGIGQENDGYFFGYNGTSFGILHRNNGSDTWVAEASWNGNLDFTWNKTFGTPVMIKYPYLGYGDITFFAQNPTNSKWVLVHTIRYANTSASVELSNPNIYFYGQALNSGNTSNLIMYCGSVGIFLSGKRSYIGNPKWTADNNKSGVTTETNILTLKNATTYNGVSNRSLIRLSNLSVSASAASGVSVIRFKINSTLGGTPSYTTINGSTADNGATITSGNSITSYDTAGTTVTGGTYIFGITVDNPDTSVIDLESYNIFIAPGETLTISGFSTISSVIGVAINFIEDI